MLTNQCAVCLPASNGDSLDDGFCRIQFKKAASEIIEEEQGFGTVAQDVVNAHCYQIYSNRVVDTDRLSYLESKEIISQAIIRNSMKY